SYFPGARKVPYRKGYLFFVCLFTLITAVTMPLNQPGDLIILSAVIGFVGTVLYSGALIFLNHRLLPRLAPHLPEPTLRSRLAITVSFLVYSGLALAFLGIQFM
ncbi:MAG TPA: hypothetical protein VLB09_08395, partial [Nitrospiria bacterium]|nr:hypothetical protein [Nitrospiria bacterium]